MILSSANMDELTHLLAFARTSLPPDRFKLGLEFAESVLDPNDCSILGSRVGAALHIIEESTG